MAGDFLLIGRKQTGRTVVELLRSHFRLTPADVRDLVKQRGILVGGEPCRDLTQTLRRGDRLSLRLNHARREKSSPRERRDEKKLPDVARNIRILYEDDQVIVVDKPAGLTTVRHATESAQFGKRALRFLPGTLVDCLFRLRAGAGKKGRIRAVHRLDKETSGLIVLALSAEAESQLGRQFRDHSVSRTYQALVRGEPSEGCIESILVPNRGDGRRGSAKGSFTLRGDEQAPHLALQDDPRTQQILAKAKGQHAVTHVRIVERLDHGALVECRLETGRTHQVRIHLGEAGMPLCGEHVYDRPIHGKPLPDPSNFSRPALHAASLAFDHPVTGKRLSFQAPLPNDMKALLTKLRATRSSPRA